MARCTSIVDQVTSLALVTAATLFIGCGGDVRTESSSVASDSTTAPVAGWKQRSFPMVEDNVRNDTLLVQVTFDLGDDTFLMVAGNVEETREGLRLYLYRPLPDSSAEVLASSKPGYDSFTMLPTFFTTGSPEDGLVLLANMGEKQSWGQEAFWLKDQRFHYLGFLDVAVREWRTAGDTTQQWRTSIAERTLVSGGNGEFEFGFTGDSLQLYDDLQGHHEVMFPASAVRYRGANGQAQLVINGTPITAASSI